MRDHDKDDKVEFKHTTGSKQPRFDLIPYRALKALADRYELGELKHKGKSWNGRSLNQAGLQDREWIIARAAHVINHALLFIAKYEGVLPDDGDDDAAAIMWGGTCLYEGKRVDDERKAMAEKQPSQAPQGEQTTVLSTGQSLKWGQDRSPKGLYCCLRSQSSAGQFHNPDCIRFVP